MFSVCLLLNHLAGKRRGFKKIIIVKELLREESFVWN